MSGGQFQRPVHRNRWEPKCRKVCVGVKRHGLRSLLLYHSHVSVVGPKFKKESRAGKRKQKYSPDGTKETAPGASQCLLEDLVGMIKQSVTLHLA